MNWDSKEWMLLVITLVAVGLALYFGACSLKAQEKLERIDEISTMLLGSQVVKDAPMVLGRGLSDIRDISSK